MSATSDQIDIPPWRSPPSRSHLMNNNAADVAGFCRFRIRWRVVIYAPHEGFPVDTARRPGMRLVVSVGGHILYPKEESLGIEIHQDSPNGGPC
jgi:hypothetical protein